MDLFSRKQRSGVRIATSNAGLSSREGLPTPERALPGALRCQCTQSSTPPVRVLYEPRRGWRTSQKFEAQTYRIPVPWGARGYAVSARRSAAVLRLRCYAQTSPWTGLVRSRLVRQTP